MDDWGIGVCQSRSDAMTIARHFNAGLNVKSIQVPEGRPTFSNEMMGNAEIIRHPFSRPCGTRAGADEYPALKRRAILGSSLRAEVLVD
jgi:hypothetical protein